MTQLGDDVVLTVNQTFPKGMALAQWLNGPIVNASPTLGQITVSGPEHSVNTVNAPTSEWIYLPGSGGALDAVPQLQHARRRARGDAVREGRVHRHSHPEVRSAAPGGDDSDPDKPFPSGCKTNMMSPQAKALEFLFFDLTSCVEPPNTMPQPPIPQPPGMTTGPPPGAGRPPAGTAATTSPSPRSRMTSGPRSPGPLSRLRERVRVRAALLLRRRSPHPPAAVASAGRGADRNGPSRAIPDGSPLLRRRGRSLPFDDRVVPE